MTLLLLLVCGGGVMGLIFIAGRSFSQSQAASTMGESFLMAGGGRANRPERG